MITFKLNGKDVQAEEGEFILQVADKYGAGIPTLCHHKALEPAGMCRLCTVELFDGRRTRFVTACNYPIWAGMEVNTDSEAVHQVRRLIVELLFARCPDVPVIKELAAGYNIEEPRFKKKDDDCILCGLCVRICEKMGNSAITLTGRGVDIKVDTPFHEQTDICMACGACASVCPTGHIKLEDITKHVVKPIPSEYDMGLKGRKPIYVPYAQAIPNKPAIDRSKCVHFKTGGCKICTEFCGVNAIDHSQEDETVELNVGAIILAPGFQPFNPKQYETYGYSAYPNVVTSMEFERILSATGPYQGHLQRPSDGEAPDKIAWLQCVGSRDINRCDHSYCSSVCCMYAIKEAVIAKEHAEHDLDAAVFFMDIRTYGKDFERYYNRAKNEQGVRFIRSRIHSISEDSDTHDLILQYADEEGTLNEEVFEMVVLSVGLETPKALVEMAHGMEIELDEDAFVRTGTFTPVETSKKGVYVCGAFQEPKDIPYSVMEASAAACDAKAILSSARGSLVKDKAYPKEIDVSSQKPRIGVFVCNCGTNIGGIVDVPQVAEYTRSLPGVTYVEENLFTCSQDTQDNMKEIIEHEGLNRVIVAACTPRTHEALFQETLRDAGLNKYLFEMANIRNQCSWVHSKEKEEATDKSKDLIRMAVARAQLIQPLPQPTISVDKKALVIGGGISGMTSTLGLADQGFHTYLIEESDRLGGNAINLIETWRGDRIADSLKEMVLKTEEHPLIEVHTKSTIKDATGFVGNFETTISHEGADTTFKHGAVVIAVGAREHKPTEYLYGENDSVLTSLELDKALKNEDKKVTNGKNTVFVQCVGSRDSERPYCSKVCCTHSIKSALELKEMNPDMDIYILYRDIRTYGQREELYREARRQGVIFIRYSLDRKPEVEQEGSVLSVIIRDYILGRDIRIEADLIVLASAIVPRDNESLARLYKLPLNEDGFFMEAHAKLRPVEFATEGIFLAGIAHYPKPIEESIAQAKAAASRASVVLSKEQLTVEGAVSHVNEIMCRGCGKCVEACPFNAIELVEKEDDKSAAYVQEALCKGCGSCAVACPTGAASIFHFDDQEVLAMVEAALN